MTKNKEVSEIVDALYIVLEPKIEYAIDFFNSDVKKVVIKGKEFIYPSEVYEAFAGLLYNSENKLLGVRVYAFNNDLTELSKEIGKHPNVVVEKNKGTIDVYFSPDRNLEEYQDPGECNTIYAGFRKSGNLYAVEITNLVECDLIEKDFDHLNVEVLKED